MATSSYSSLISEFLRRYHAGREDKLNADNRSVVNSYQVELTEQIGSLCNIVSSSIARQEEHLQCVEKLCASFLSIHDKVFN